MTDAASKQSAAPDDAVATAANSNMSNDKTSATAATAVDGDGAVVVTATNKTTNENGAAAVADRLMQSTYDNIQSASSTIVDEENIKKAISFLRNRDIRDISPKAKREYLTKVGMSTDEIDTALDRMATTASATTDAYQHQRMRQDGDYHRHVHHQQHNNYDAPQSFHNHHMNFAHHNNDMIGNNKGEEGGSTPFFSLYSWVGGFCMSTFCLAALRWLNGGDFVLFPPPAAAVATTQIKQSKDETQNDGNTADGKSIELNGQDGDDQASFNSHESGDPDLSMILNGTANHDTVHKNQNHSSSLYEDLVTEVKALSSAINSFREEQDRANRVTAAQLGKGVTDDAMDFLRQQRQQMQPVPQKKPDQTIIDTEDISRIRSLVTEIVHELSQLKNSFNDDDMVDAEGNNRTETKIDIAVEKGKEILALLTRTDEISSEKIDTQQVTQVEEGTIEKDSEKNPNNDTQSEESKDVDCDMSEPVDAASAVHENAVEIGDANLSSNDLEKALKILSQNNREELKVGAQMLYLYCKNLSKNPTVPRYRKIYTNNSSFKSKVDNLLGTRDFLFALGFVERTNFFEWSPSNETSSDTKSQLDFALVALEMLQNGSQKIDDDVHSTSNTREKFAIVS